MLSSRILPDLAAAILLIAWPLSAAYGGERAEAVDHSALRVCSDPGNMPFSNTKGEGFENKIAELFAQKLGVPVHYTWFPQATGFLRNTLRARRCDLVMGIVSGAELAQSTNPYYRSSYVMVTRTEDHIDVDRIEDLRDTSHRVGLIAGTPPAYIVANSDLMARARPYDLMVDTRFDSPSRRMIQDLVDKKIDVALLWGPLGGYFASQHGDALAVKPLLKEPKTVRMDYYITMGVRPGETRWKQEINKLIGENREAISKILHGYHVPLLDAQGRPIP
ncbi:MAG TPA: substrate-binding domain-containing protein [Ferrovibrio sp.]|uniref:substrate-binding domain-containing protein n=1 Tax=Ferrovibrio sp. TaxID=1917215 RepID=UPI002ED1413A